MKAGSSPALPRQRGRVARPARGASDPGPEGRSHARAASGASRGAEEDPTTAAYDAAARRLHQLREEHTQPNTPAWYAMNRAIRAVRELRDEAVKKGTPPKEG